jgi:hypothetical protein
MNGTRRGFGKLAMVGLSGMIGIAGIAEVEPSAEAQSAGRPNRSLIHGVQFGLQPFCYHDLAMNTQNRPELVRRLVQNGMGMVELHATWCEPRFNDPDVSPEVARKKLRDWRVSAPADYYRKIKKEFDDAGITIFTYYVNISEEDTDAEIDATYEAAEILGAKGAVGSYGLAIARRLVPFPAKHGIFAGLHNHDNLSDPDAFSNEASIEKGLAYSPDFKATLDVRHFTAGNGDCLGFLERHHDRVSTAAARLLEKATRRSSKFSG